MLLIDLKGGDDLAFVYIGGLVYKGRDKCGFLWSIMTSARNRR